MLAASPYASVCLIARRASPGRWVKEGGGMGIVDLVSTASGNLGRERSRSALTVLAVFTGTLSIALTAGMGLGVSAYVDKQLANLGAPDELLVQPQTDYGPGGSGSPQPYRPGSVVAAGPFGLNQPMLTPDDLRAIRAQPGVVSAQPNLGVAADYIAGPNGQKYQISLLPAAGRGVPDLAAGRPANAGSDAPELLLPVAYLQPLGFSSPQAAVGREVALAVTDAGGQQHHQTATVTGVRRQTLVNINGANANQALLGALYHLQTRGLPPAAKNRYPAVTARFAPDATPSQLQRIKDGLRAKGYTAMTVKDRIGIFKQVVNAITIVLLCFGAVALLAASLGIINTLFMAVHERTREIGLMKALGLSRAKVFALFSIEAVLLGLWGSLAGVLAALGAGRLANHISEQTFLKSLPGFNLTVFSARDLAVIVAVILLVAFASGTLPARRAARQDPIEALQYE